MTSAPPPGRLLHARYRIALWGVVLDPPPFQVRSGYVFLTTAHCRMLIIVQGGELARTISDEGAGICAFRL
ncbi:hypothetical protein SKAU_G00300990 [Synaphobranchus kaupii]|uniref:Uncharacterized protein n=1 Tax=Synaphobranchus kaupii TaxID=118154 RepID=A0A9Q1EVK4_SYNKA|nr:hypothetical protein SKAU_G00300990 [Synaphobranchus kaupii]